MRCAADWFLFEVRLVGDEAFTAAGSVAGVRNMHAIFGKTDYPKYNGACRILLKYSKRGVSPKRKTTLQIEMSGRSVEDSRGNKESYDFEEVVTADMAAFPFLLR